MFSKWKAEITAATTTNYRWEKYETERICENGWEVGEKRIKNRGYQVNFGKVWKGQLFSLDNKEGGKDTYSKK